MYKYVHLANEWIVINFAKYSVNMSFVPIEKNYNVHSYNHEKKIR
jgi:hypothetical protein